MDRWLVLGACVRAPHPDRCRRRRWCSPPPLPLVLLPLPLVLLLPALVLLLPALALLLLAKLSVQGAPRDSPVGQLVSPSGEALPVPTRAPRVAGFGRTRIQGTRIQGTRPRPGLDVGNGAGSPAR